MPESDISKIRQEAGLAAELARGANDRLDNLTKDLQGLVTNAVEKAMATQPRISEEEREFLSLAVRAKAQQVRLRQAIIEKTVPSLVWALLAGAFWLFKHMVEEYLKSKGLPIPWK